MRKTENLISLLGGALAGAAAMYLLDPELGKRRRRYIADQAGEYLHSTGEALQSGWETLGQRAHDVGQTITDKAQDYGSRLGDLAQDYASRAADQARGIGDSAAEAAGGLRRSGWRLMDRLRGHVQDRADDYSENVSDYGNRLWKRVRNIGNTLSRSASDAAERARHAVQPQRSAQPVILTGLGCCALGVGLMYLMDPQRGRARRAWLGDKFASLTRRTGRSFYRTGRDLANRAYGVAAETRGRFRQSQPLSSEQLLNRVRSEIGHVVSHPRLVQAMADANGCVTLSGRVLTSEAGRLVSTVESVPGVSLVVNRLDVKPNEQELQAGQEQQGVAQM